jgi:hypothetical protein
MSKATMTLGAILFSLGLAGVPSAAGDDDCFATSLHATGEGMRYWYEEEGGLMQITGIPYRDLDCSNCHIKSCDQCHAARDASTGTCTYSNSQARKTDTCLPCHGREALTYRMCEKAGNVDVHGSLCTDCHGGADVHGDGQTYRSMRDAHAVKASCLDCHEGVASDIRPHTVHKGKLDCAACHVVATTACMNCHMDTFLATGSRKGTFFPIQDWLLLINHEGKVTSATAMTIVYQDKKFICYGPYFTHAVQPKGKQCGDCHGNEAVKMIKDGQRVPMMTYKDGNVVAWKGVVPVVADQLDWTYLNKVGDTWVPVEGNGKETVQYVEYGTPLTEEQIKKMAMPFEQ